jgi:hypothetical protein
VASLERSVPGQALVLCAGERVFLDVEASPDEKELFDTRPSEQAERNRERRQLAVQLEVEASLSTGKPAHAAPPAPFETAPPAGPESSLTDTSWRLFDDLEPDEGASFPLPTWRRRP